jgi:hypothetical protein|eukprot:scaffold158549_cov75-Cyclotella_meneghiniana.AAC.3
MNYLAIIAAASATLCQANQEKVLTPSPHSGPGKIECLEGTCDLSIDQTSSEDVDLLLSSEEGRYSLSGVFQFSSSGTNRISGKSLRDPSHELCYYKEVTETGTKNWWKTWDLKVNEGCSISSARFESDSLSSPSSAIFTGPGFLTCDEGACYNFGSKANSCGAEIHGASEEWGGISLLGYSSDETVFFSGYNGITTTEAIKVHAGCALECSGCEFTRQQITDVHSYSGGGKIECLCGACDLSIDQGVDAESYMMSKAFEHSHLDSSSGSGKTTVDPSHKLCYFKEVSETGTSEWWNQLDLKLTGECSVSAKFDSEPAEIFAGPGLLTCTQGTCSNHAHEPNNCGNEIQEASEHWGTLSLLGYSTDETVVFSGFSGISTTEAIMINAGCAVECSGCEFTRQKTVNRLGAKSERHTVVDSYSNDV